jgi:hypothetical protein
MWDETVAAYFKLLSQHCMRGLEKTTKMLNQYIWFASSETNSEHAKYEMMKAQTTFITDGIYFTINVLHIICTETIL